MKLVAQFMVLLVMVVTARAQTLTNGQAWQYQLTDGAALIEDCLNCDHLSAWAPLKGTFDLVGTATAGQYVVTNINFRTMDGVRNVFGNGTVTFSGATPTLTLVVYIVWNDGSMTEYLRMFNAPAESPRIFPMIGANVNANEGTGSVYRLRIQAAPIRELWFSTATNFTSAQLGIAVSQGDLLSTSPRIVKTNSELTERLSIPEGDVGLDGVDIGPRGEIFFSTTTNVESAVNGAITDGDIVTSEGRVYLQSAQLLSAFGVDDPEAGLDALHLAPNDEIYFSITKDIPRAGAATLHRGDILSNSGRIVRTEANLLVRWNVPAGVSVGVDALFVWPNGEIWFSTENGFTNTAGVAVSSGDIISDQGYVAFRNYALLRPFAPTEQNSDFGLDALVVVSDAAASQANNQFLDVSLTDDGVDLRWDSTARLFQVEHASAVEGPYTPATAIIVERAAHIDSPNAPGFYRIRQW
jgi:hypothetical protein